MFNIFFKYLPYLKKNLVQYLVGQKIHSSLLLEEFSVRFFVCVDWLYP